MQQVGMVGLGLMGSRMARNLMKAGMKLSVWNRSPQKARPLVLDGAIYCPSLATMASGVSHIVIMVYGPEALLNVVNQMAAYALTDKIVVNCSTVSPMATIQASKRIERAGGHFIDAPVSGSLGPAESGELVFMVGGEEEHIASAKQLFDILGKKAVHCGPIGAGTRMKLSIQLLLGSILGGLSEAMLFASKSGLDLEDFMDVANNGAMACPMVEAKGGAMAKGDFEAVSPMPQLQKDIGLALHEASSRRLSLPQSVQLMSLVERAMETEVGDMDVSAIFKQLLNETK